jgi:NADH dehydrogenase FAD-containing subunit
LNWPHGLHDSNENASRTPRRRWLRSVYTAQRLEQILARRKDVELTLIRGENFLLFTPMLAEVVSSSIEANHIVSPIRAFFRTVRFSEQ